MHTGHGNQHAGPVHGILQALVVGQSLAEGRMFRGKKLASKEGLHDGDAHALFGTPLEQVEPLLDGADAILVALFKIVGRIDGEHHHVNPAGIDDAVGNGRGMGGEADVAHNALGLQFL